MNLTDNQIKFVNDAITLKVQQEESNIKQLEREIAVTNEISMKRSLERCIKNSKVIMDELKELRRMFND